jgi:hypothetical protein
MTWHAQLTKHHACEEAIEWAKPYKTFTAAWNACERGDWMLWLVAKSEVDCKAVVLAACACARTALKYVQKGDKRPLIAIKTAERWAHGEATIEEVRDAAADAAAYAARSKSLKRSAALVRKHISARTVQAAWAKGTR